MLDIESHKVVDMFVSHLCHVCVHGVSLVTVFLMCWDNGKQVSKTNNFCKVITVMGWYYHGYCACVYHGYYTIVSMVSVLLLSPWLLCWCYHGYYANVTMPVLFSVLMLPWLLVILPCLLC